jgi:hypothetical protein
MSTLADILDGIEAISKSIENMGNIVEAINSGQDYLEQRYKEAQNDVRDILEEMNKTLITTSSATSIVTHFSFIDDPSTFAGDLREFNNRIIDGKSEILDLRQKIDDYRGHCSKIEHHVEKIKNGGKLDSLFRIFGVDSKQENEKLSQYLQDIYNEELNHYLAVNALCDNLEKALIHVHETLGGPGLLKPEKVPEAAALLAEYGKAFMRIESQANHRVLEIRKLIRALS